MLIKNYLAQLPLTARKNIKVYLLLFLRIPRYQYPRYQLFIQNIGAHLLLTLYPIIIYSNLFQQWHIMDTTKFSFHRSNNSLKCFRGIFSALGPLRPFEAETLKAKF